jgi:hypothetical protein
MIDMLATRGVGAVSEADGIPTAAALLKCSAAK